MPRNGIVGMPACARQFNFCLILIALIIAIPSQLVRGQTDLATPGATSAASTDAAGSADSTAIEAGGSDSVPGETKSSTYRLQPYDLIDIDVYSEADLHKPARLGSDGTILLPLVGSVKVGGLTVAEATDLIAKRYAAGFVKNPSVLITVLQYRKRTFSLLGGVAKPGIYEISEGAQVSILEAVSMAGGFTGAAEQNAVTVKRAVDGNDTIVKVRAGDMAQNPNVAPFALLPGDTVVVPTSRYRKDSFSMLGQVQKPGLYEIPDGEHVTIMDALSLAGGNTPSASLSSITVKRVMDGHVDLIHVNASDMGQNPSVAAFEILPGDSVFIPFRNSTFSILGQVERPGIYEVPEGSHVNIVEAILMAGGFTRTAAQNSVMVKRTVDGKPKAIKVKAGDMAQEPDVVPFEVLPGDIIKVNESWF